MLPEEHKILIKKHRNKKRVWYEETAYRIPNKHWPLTTVKRLQWKIDDIGTDIRQVNLAVEENENLFDKNVV